MILAKLEKVLSRVLMVEWFLILLTLLASIALLYAQYYRAAAIMSLGSLGLLFASFL